MPELKWSSSNVFRVGYIALALKTADPLSCFRKVVEMESTKIGVVLLVLDAMHFFNMPVLAKMRHRSAEKTAIQSLQGA